MTKFYVKGATRMYKDNLIDAWIKAEENLGLKNSIFFWENGTTTQWVDNEEGEKFEKHVKDGLKINGWFDEVCDCYYEAIENKDKVKVFECLAIFNEMDENQEISLDFETQKKLLRLREQTHNVIYEMEDLKK